MKTPSHLFFFLFFLEVGGNQSQMRNCAPLIPPEVKQRWSQLAERLQHSALPGDSSTTTGSLFLLMRMRA